MTFTKMPDEKLEKLDSTVASFFKKDIGLRPILKKDRIFDKRTWGVKSLKTEQECALIASITV